MKEEGKYFIVKYLNIGERGKIEENKIIKIGYSEKGYGRR